MLVLTLQSIAPAIRLGPTGNRLTSDDIDQIGRLDFGGRAVWVLEGKPRGFEPSNSWYVVAYLEPDQIRADIRRGRLAVLKAEMTSPEAYDGPKKWAVVSTGDYAQVPLSGAKPDAVAGGRDLSRPFRVVGAIDDDSLVAIVSFIRTGPANTAPSPNDIFRRVEKSWPVDSVIQLSADAVEVSLLDSRPNEKSGQKVIVRREPPSWRVVRLMAWIAD